MSLEVDTTATICAEFVSQPARRLVHLVNYEPRQVAAHVPVRIEVPQNRRPTRIRIADPLQAEDIEVPFEYQERTVGFVVPRISVYAVAIVEFE